MLTRTFSPHLTSVYSFWLWSIGMTVRYNRTIQVQCKATAKFMTRSKKTRLGNFTCKVLDQRGADGTGLVNKNKLGGGGKIGSSQENDLNIEGLKEVLRNMHEDVKY